MSVYRLPSGRWRAQVWDCREGRNVSVSQVLADCYGTFRTREAAVDARERARAILEARPRRCPPLERRALPPVEWHLQSKGESHCRVCGASATHLHHIVPKAVAPEGRRDWANNGLPLCARCHHGWHVRALEISHDAFTDAEFQSACELAGVAWVERHYTAAEPAARRLNRVRSRKPQPRHPLHVVLEATA